MNQHTSFSQDASASAGNAQKSSCANSSMEGPASPHDAAMKALENVIHLMGDRINALEQRLAPVSSPQPTQSDGGKILTDGHAVPAIQKLNRLRTFVEGHVATLESAIDRLGI